MEDRIKMFRRVTLKKIPFIGLLFLFILPSLAYSELKTISYNELKPGMKGYALSVFSGTEVEKFNVVFVSVVDGPHPGSKSFLVRINKRGLPHGDHTVGRGFSGSPVYFKGRLAGAISYADSLQTEMIIGVTPVEQMIEELEVVEKRAGWKRTGGEAEEAGNEGSPIEAGGMISIPMVRGDIWMAASGTVTAVDGKTVIAFGHQMFFSGDSLILPMHTAKVNAIIPKLDLSYKNASGLEEAGALYWDGKAAIVGRLGEKAPMLPLEITYLREKERTPKKYELEIIRHRKMISGLVTNLISSVSGVNGHKSPDEKAVEVIFKIVMAKDDPYEVSRRFTLPQLLKGNGPNTLLSGFLAGLKEGEAPESMSIHLRELADGRTGGIEKAYFGRREAVPGEKVLLYVDLRHDVGEKMTVKVEVPVPADFSKGVLPVLVLPGSSVRPKEIAPQNPLEMRKWVAGILRSDDLVVLLPGNRDANESYESLKISRQVLRVPWALTGSAEASIRVKE